MPSINRMLVRALDSSALLVWLPFLTQSITLQERLIRFPELDRVLLCGMRFGW